MWTTNTHNHCIYRGREREREKLNAVKLVEYRNISSFCWSRVYHQYGLRSIDGQNQRENRKMKNAPKYCFMCVYGNEIGRVRAKVRASARARDEEIEQTEKRSPNRSRYT